MSEQDPVAVIGLAGRFPGAANVHALWNNLCRGIESVTFFRLEDLDASIPAALKHDPAYVPARGVLEDAVSFDASLFSMTPREAQVMDPQHRVLLEAAWAALESAGYPPGGKMPLTGIFAGCSANSYWENNILTRPDILETYGRYQLGQVSYQDYISTRIAYKLDLKGPALSVNTACSTSLVAVCLAFQSLQNYECDMALAGGSAVDFPMRQGHLYQEGGIFSPDGHCRTFDKNAGGTYASNGAGMVVLKRLSDAIADKDPIFAVIKGVGLNNDGADKVGYTAPSVNGQATAIAMAQAIAEVEPETISYIEAHGTGTPLGDPIEIEALRKVFGSGPQKTCAIGSIKSNFGHLDAAAGVAGLIKTALALHHGRIPPSLNFSEPNPKINFAQSPFYVNTELAEWPRGEKPRRAGVSSFGMGGTNAHVVLEEAPAVTERAPDFAAAPVLLLSARSESGLQSLAAELGDALADASESTLRQAAWTLQVRRKHFEHRRYVVCENPGQALAMLADPRPSHSGAATAAKRTPDVVMSFPGQGCQYVGMADLLRERLPAFRRIIEDCSAIAEPIIGESLRDVMYPAEADVAAAGEKLNQTLITQPALFAVEYALARLWMDWGVQPAAFIGHSIGEFVAAALAGVFSFEDAVRLVAHRARLMQSTTPGGMLSVRLPETELRSRLPEGTELAAVNAPALCVAAGPNAAIEVLEKVLAKEDVACSRLHTSHAFHSVLMEPVIAEFTEIVASVDRAPASLPFVSCTTGQWITDEEAQDPAYWGRHLRQTVRFADGMGTLLDAGHGVFLECGPRRTLSTLARQMAGAQANLRAVATLDTNGDTAAERIALAKAIGEAWCAGLPLDWRSMYAGEPPRTVFLPNTPFDRKPHFIEPGQPGTHSAPPPPAEAVLPEPESMNDTRGMAPAPAADAGGRTTRMEAILRELVTDLSGIAPEDLPADRSFLELGLDSLLLTQLALAIKNRFGVEISFRELMDNLPSIGDVVGYLDETLPPAEFAAAPAPAGSATPAEQTSSARHLPVSGAGAEVDVAALIDSQMQLMQQQIALLERLGGAPASPPGTTPAPATSAADRNARAEARIDAASWSGFGPSAKIHRDAVQPAEADRGRFDAILQRYLAKTGRSREWVRQNRARLSDPRTVSGFRRDLKEVVYPIVVSKSQGATLWDLDGNEYVDLTNGFGSVLLGHRPQAVTDAIAQQLALGWEIGPQTVLAGDVAALVTELTGHERVAFCNTGSEAVLAAIRMARTVSGKDRIAVFGGSYHGMFDEVIARPLPDGRAMPAAPGIPRSATEQLLFLEYGSPSAFAELERQASSLAAVLVEPVQSRRPELQPWDFLRELRQVTEKLGVALVFDEVITGFRAHPGGVQGMLGIQVDLATYGKVAGGGLPLGLVAGRAAYMDALDGGTWDYGDDSYPVAGVTMFAGTFVRHPLTLAAAKATLATLRDAGAGLQEGLNAKTAKLAEALNRECSKRNAPIDVASFSSFFYINLHSASPSASLLFWLLREKGVHVWDQRPCFLTTAHTDADLETVVRAFAESLEELQAGGLLEGGADPESATASAQAAEPPVPGARLGRTPEGDAAWFVADPERPGKYLQVAADR